MERCISLCTTTAIRPGRPWTDRIEGPIKIGLQGFEVALRAKQALIEAQRELEERDPGADDDLAQVQADGPD
jgi:hypothetical protein